ncbi:hypothetical protein [Allokutzneria oryzae]|uniref:Uncharacterized protein n=1 Tax=Allokutzneria oryzae TaxID=1378989 RepID=A0ABV5ZPT3_9PSEU
MIPTDPRAARTALLGHLRDITPRLADGTALNGLECFGSSDPDEWLIRLAGFAISVLRAHQVDEHGRCRRCRTPRRGARALLPTWSRRNLCHTLSAALVMLGSDPTTAWWHALTLSGQRHALADVHAWLTDPDDAPGRHHLDTDVDAPTDVLPVLTDPGNPLSDTPGRRM